VDGHLEQAGSEVKYALQEDPRDAASHFLLGCLLVRKGEHDQALVAFQRAVAIDPANPEALYNLGTMLLRRGAVVPAARLLESALLLRPNFLPAGNNLAKAYFLSGLPELAVATYEETLRRDPGNVVALRNLLLLAEGSGLQDAAVAYRQRLAALGSGQAAQPRIDAGEPLALLPVWPVTTLSTGAPSANAPPADRDVAQQVRADPEAEALRALVAELPHVTVARRGGRLSVGGWTSGQKEKELLGRILGKPAAPQGKHAAGPDGQAEVVLDLTSEDAWDTQRMIEVDAVIFLVNGLDETSVGFNFLKAINLNFKYFATDQERDGSGFAAPGVIGNVNGLAQQGWIFGASVDYTVNIANASDLRVAVLARPHLTALSQTRAEFLAGGELVYKVSGINSGDIKAYPFGTSLKVTPTLLRTPAEDGTPRVHLKVEAARTSVLSLLSADPSQPTSFQKVTVSSEAVIKLDHTLILSGLSQREDQTKSAGVPFLRSIPVLKYFFSQRDTVLSDSAVVILLSPRDAAFTDERNRKALTLFVEERRAFLKAKHGGAEDMARFRQQYRNWEQIPPNRFASHIFLMQNSALYRAVSQQELGAEDLDLELLGPSP
jgi:hypothetical protein